MVAILLAGVLYGRKSDLVSEVYHFIGALSATFITLHYFVGFGRYIGKSVFVSVGYQETLAFYILASVILFFFFVSQGGWSRLLNFDTPEFLDKWGSLALSVLRSVLYCGLVFLALAISRDGIVSKDVKQSLTSPMLKQVSIATYGFVFQGVVKPIFRAENFNEGVYYILSPKKKAEVEQDEEESK